MREEVEAVRQRGARSIVLETESEDVSSLRNTIRKLDACLEEAENLVSVTDAIMSFPPDVAHSFVAVVSRVKHACSVLQRRLETRAARIQADVSADLLKCGQSSQVDGEQFERRAV